MIENIPFQLSVRRGSDRGSPVGWCPVQQVDDEDESQRHDTWRAKRFHGLSKPTQIDNDNSIVCVCEAQLLVSMGSIDDKCVVGAEVQPRRCESSHYPSWVHQYCESPMRREIRWDEFLSKPLEAQFGLSIQ